MREIAQESFSRLRKIAQKNFKGIVSDVDTVARQYGGSEGSNQTRRDREEAKALRDNLACKIQKLKEKHQRVLQDISQI